MRFHVRQVGDPEPVGCRRPEDSGHQVSGAALVVAGDRGDHRRRAPAGAGEAQLTHEPLDGPAGYAVAFAVELGPDLVGAVHEQVSSYTRLISISTLRPAACGSTAPASWPRSRCS